MKFIVLHHIRALFRFITKLPFISTDLIDYVPCDIRRIRKRLRVDMSNLILIRYLELRRLIVRITLPMIALSVLFIQEEQLRFVVRQTSIPRVDEPLY